MKIKMKPAIQFVFVVAVSMGSIHAFCEGARQGIEQGASSLGQSVNDKQSCLNFCGMVSDPQCPTICQTCYRETAAKPSEPETVTHQADADDPRATQTEKRLIAYLLEHGHKEEAGSGAGFSVRMQNLTKAQAKALRIKAQVNSVDDNTKGCTVKLKESNGGKLQLTSVGYVGENRKLCKKIKKGKKIVILPDTVVYMFMRKVPTTGKENVGMLMVFPK